MTTNNEAMKALDILYTLSLSRPDNDATAIEYIARERNKVYTALAKSAKVDGLLEALEIIKKECMSVEAMKAPARSLGSVLFTINDAIQRFNGEV